jgi:hypothetical protein
VTINTTEVKAHSPEPKSLNSRLKNRIAIVLNLVQSNLNNNSDKSKFPMLYLLLEKLPKLLIIITIFNFVPANNRLR